MTSNSGFNNSNNSNASGQWSDIPLDELKPNGNGAKKPNGTSMDEIESSKNTKPESVKPRKRSHIVVGAFLIIVFLIIIVVSAVLVRGRSGKFVITLLQWRGSNSSLIHGETCMVLRFSTLILFYFIALYYTVWELRLRFLLQNHVL